MSYNTPTQLAEQLQISLKTVYNYITKYPDKIRTQKQFWKTLVNVQDFQNIVTKNYNPVNHLQQENLSWKEDVQNIHSPSKRTNEQEENDLRFTLWKVQSELQTLQNQKEQLHQYNNALQDQVTKYALLLQDEKTEKKHLLEQYTTLQQELIVKIESLTKQRENATKKLYLFVGLCVSLLAIILQQIRPALQILFRK